jgi:hypothetical protein
MYLPQTDHYYLWFLSLVTPEVRLARISWRIALLQAENWYWGCVRRSSTAAAALHLLFS